MIVVMTDEALADMSAIRDHVALDSPLQADRIVERLFEVCETLSDTPLAWPLLARHRESGVRRRIAGNYLVFFRIMPDRIEVLHILHGARDYEAILFPGDDFA